MTTRARHGHRPLRSMLLAAVVTATAIWPVPDGAWATPVVIGPSEVADGSLHLTPAVQAVGDDEAVWVLANGGDRPVTFALSLHDVVVGQDGRAAVGPSASSEPPADEVTLAPREQARIAVTLTTAEAIALQAAAEGAPPLHAFAVAGDGGVGADVTLDTAHGRAFVQLSSDTPTVATVSIAVAGWPGRDLGTTTIGPLAIIPPGISLTANIHGAVGPTTVAVAATSVGGATATAQTSAFVVTRTESAIVAVLALALAIAALVAAVRRRRRSPAPPTIEENS